MSTGAAPGSQPRSKWAFAGNASSYIFVGAYAIWFWVRTVWLGPVVSIALIVLSLIELVGPLTHTFLGEIPNWARITVTSLLLITASILIYHHWRLGLRLRRHVLVLGSMGALLDAESERDPGTHNVSSITSILDTLVFSVRKSETEGVQINSAVLIREDDQKAFEVKFQDRQNAFPAEIRLNPRLSAAGSLLQEQSGTLLYVPSTRFTHGLKIAREETRVRAHGEVITQTFKALDIVPSAFQIVSAENQRIVRSLLCVQVPLGSADTAKLGRAAVLCLSANRPRRMSYLEFSVIKLAAALVSFILRDATAGWN